MPIGNYEFELKTCLYGKCSESKSLFIEIQASSLHEIKMFQYSIICIIICFFFQAEDGIRDLVRSRGLGDVYNRQVQANLE